MTQLAGEVGEKLHTGRSRNDQVATDLRLYAKGELLAVAKAVMEMQEVLLGRARDAGDAVIAGYTHLQRAQPVLLAHHLLAHGWAFARDVDRILAARERLDVSPLGAGALGGTSLPLQPAFTASELGFAEPFQNSLDAVSDRDFAAECLFVLALLGVHSLPLGRGDHFLCFPRGRLHPFSRCLFHRKLHAASQEKSRHSRVGPRQVWSSYRQSHRSCWPC